MRKNRLLLNGKEEPENRFINRISQFYGCSSSVLY